MLRRVRLARRPVFVDLQQGVVTAQRRIRALPAAVLATALRQPERHALVTRTPLRSVYLWTFIHWTKRGRHKTPCTDNVRVV